MVLYFPSKTKSGQVTQRESERTVSGLKSEMMDREEQARRQEIRRKYEEVQEELRSYVSEVQRQEILMNLHETQEEVQVNLRQKYVVRTFY